MSILKCFTAVWVSIIIYSFLSAFFGAAGLSSSRLLMTERDRLSENMEKLQIINHELSGSVSALRYDSDTIALYARELGYGAQNERFIRIAGLQSVNKKSLSAGRQIIPAVPASLSDRTIHIVSFSAGMLTFLLLIVFGRRRANNE